MSAKEYSLLIENLLQKINPSIRNKSDEILTDPYKEIIIAVEYRVSQKKLERFQLCFQGISGKSLQELVDENYDVNQLLKDLQQLVEKD